MSTRRFLIVVALLGLALLLASSPLGVLVGFFEGITVAFFVAPAIFLLHVPESWLGPIVWALLAAYAVWVLVLIVRGVRDWLAGNGNAARAWWAGALTLVSVVGVLKLSMDAMVAAWP